LKKGRGFFVCLKQTPTFALPNQRDEGRFLKVFSNKSFKIKKSKKYLEIKFKSQTFATPNNE
jgi:hypothetical protein